MLRRFAKGSSARRLLKIILDFEPFDGLEKLIFLFIGKVFFVFAAFFKYFLGTVEKLPLPIAQPRTTALSRVPKPPWS
jgi:hypothetical protein